MKKTLLLCLAVVMIAAALVGCGTKEDAEVQKFDGKISKDWTAVKDEYQKLESGAENEVNKVKKVSKKDVAALVKTIKEDSKKLENGVTDDNEKTAKEMYKAAYKLEAYSKKDASLANNEVVTLGTDAKALVKHYYGEATEDFDVVKTRVGDKVSKIENYGEKEWDKFISIFK